MSEVLAGKEQTNPKTSRQWAWEFLRRNPAYREAYAQWMELPEAVRLLQITKPDLCELLSEKIPMSYFVVEDPLCLDKKWNENLRRYAKVKDLSKISPCHSNKGMKPLKGESLKEWRERTREIRGEISYSIRHSSSILPKKKFGIKKWIDPEISPLPVSDADIFEELKFEVYAEFLNSENFRHKPCSTSVLNIERTEIVLKIDVMQPINFLKEQLDKVVQEQREIILKIMEEYPGYFCGKKDGIYFEYKGRGTINKGGIYNQYLKILDKILKGESRKDILYADLGFSRPRSIDNYVETMEKRYNEAISIRDIEYRKIAYFDDYRGERRKIKNRKNI